MEAVYFLLAAPPLSVVNSSFRSLALLMLSDNNLKSLEKRVNEQFKNIDVWLLEWFKKTFFSQKHAVTT